MQRVQSWLGHTTPMMTQRYAHLSRRVDGLTLPSRSRRRPRPRGRGTG